VASVAAVARRVDVGDAPGQPPAARHRPSALASQGGAVKRDPKITDDILRERIMHLEPVFDSHDLIEALMKHHPKEYTEDLYSFIDSDDPIQSLHQSLGRRLLGIDQIERSEGGKVASRNVRGGDTLNQEWRRR
jgi:hypothetical protein